MSSYEKTPLTPSAPPLYTAVAVSTTVVRGFDTSKLFRNVNVPLIVGCFLLLCQPLAYFVSLYTMYACVALYGVTLAAVNRAHPSAQATRALYGVFSLMTFALSIATSVFLVSCAVNSLHCNTALIVYYTSVGVNVVGAIIMLVQGIRDRA
eukprot:m.122018 g.122018  ORF g.122018 m.122018 type:complete len:151 (-) comp13715_c0_seq2:162-614(-)